MINYAIPVWNEHKELELLLKHLMPFVGEDDYITVQGDQGKVTDAVLSVIAKYVKNPQFNYIEYPLRKDFATFKNNLLINTKSDYTILIDADEIPTNQFLENIKQILVDNPEVDLYTICRSNIVIGLNDDAIKKYNWHITKYNIFNDELKYYKLKSHVELINFPDKQARIIKNGKNIRYEGSVHEQLKNAKNIADLPFEVDWSFFHVKTIDRQHSQNNFYNTF